MKICFVAFYYTPTNPKNPHSLLKQFPIIKELPQSLAALDHQVAFVHLHPTSASFVENGVHYHFINSRQPYRWGANLLSRFLGQDAAYYDPGLPAIKKIKALKPDIIHIHGLNLYWPVLLLQQAFGPQLPPLIMHAHGGGPASKWFMRQLQKYTYQRCTYFLFTAAVQAQPFIEAGSLKSPQVLEFMEVSTPFKRQDRSIARAKTGLQGQPIFIWTGHLSPLKDPLTALKGFHKIIQTWPKASLYMYYLSDGLLPELQDFVGTNGLDKHVHFQGRVAHEHLEALYNSADFFLQASQREYSGYAPLEAMACGLIPILTAIPAFEKMTENGRYGVLFPIGDAQTLAQKTLAIPLTQIPHLSQEIAQHFQKQFSYPVLGQQLDDIYRSALA